MSNSWLFGFAGGCLIGLGSLLALIVTRKIPGISGVFGRLLVPSTSDKLWRFVFLIGLVTGAGVLFSVSETASEFSIPAGRGGLLYCVAGFVVGFGTRLGGGCTSGHGVCGMGMGLKDSMVATMVFMIAGFATVFVGNLIFANA